MNSTSLCTGSSCRNTTINFGIQSSISTAIVFIIGGSIGIIPNFIIVAGIYLKTSLHRSTFYLIANLAICDLVLGTATLLNVALAYINYTKAISVQLHLVLCRILVTFLNNLSYTASIQTLIFISIERFQAIFNPTKVLSTKKSTYLCFLAWGIALVISIPTAFFASIRRLHLKFCISFDIYTPWTTVINLVLFIAQFVCPALIMTVLYSLILHRLFAGGLAGQIDSQRSRQVKRRTIYMLLTTTTIFLALSAPWAIGLFVVVITGKLPSQIIPSTNDPTIRSIIRLSIIMLPYTTLYNPLVYCTFNSEIRQLFLPTCRFTCRRNFTLIQSISNRSNATNNESMPPISTD